MLVSISSVYGFLSEAEVEKMEELIEITDEEGECPSPDRLSGLISSCGLASLDDFHLELVASRFELYSAIIADYLD